MHEWILVNGTRCGGIEIYMRYPQVFLPLTGCQRNPRVLGCHISGVMNVAMYFHVVIHSLNNGFSFTSLLLITIIKNMYHYNLTGKTLMKKPSK